MIQNQTAEVQHRLRSLLQRPAAARLFAALDGDGEELRIVGGAVRDALLGLPVDEIDLAFTGAPETTVARARKAGLKTVPTGIEHGTVTVLVDRTPFEITTLREDVETDGRRAVVRFGRDFDADARRRDFTINALSLDGRGQLHDPAGGLDDLAGPGGAPRVRFIGDANQRIREDYLRTLRFFRFQARFGCATPDPQGLAAAIQERDGLAQLSRERIRAELLKLLAAHGAARALELMSGAGVLQCITGMVAEPGRLTRLMAWQAASASGPDPVLRLAACMVRISEDAQHLQQRLRLSGAESTRLLGIAKTMERLRAMETLTIGGARTIAAESSGAVLHDAMLILREDARPYISQDVRDYVQAMASGAVPEPVFPLRGADLLALGVPAGPAMGAILGQLRLQWLAEACPTGDAAQADLRARAKLLTH